MKCNVTKLCTSCGACSYLCPTKAISFESINIMNGKVALIDNNICINCNLCRNKCPQNKKLKLNDIISAFGAFSVNKPRKSSSGGIAALIYEKAIQNGWFCYGTTIVNKVPSFVEFNNKNTIGEVVGSKYLWSETDNIYVKVKERLLNNNNVVFIGLPCQVAGLKSFLGKDYANLYCCDLICHGTPSFELFDNYLQHFRFYNKISVYEFRNSKQFELKLFEGKKVLYKKVSWLDPYFTSFLKSSIYRDACYECNYANNKRIGDLTLGDLWGLDKPIFNNYDSFVSSVLINSKKGEALFNLIKDSMQYQSFDINFIVKNNPQLNCPAKKTNDYFIFSENFIKTGDFIKSFNKTSLKKQIAKYKYWSIIKFIPKQIMKVVRKK